MKKLLPFVFLLFSFISEAQQSVVFCPPGAKWHYNFAVYGWQIFMINKTAEYVGDTIIENKPVKIIIHPQINRNCGGCYTTRTYIKQEGDTIFMINACSSGWQILYNFATPAGGQWTTVYDNSIYTVTVDTVKTITINGINLKQLIISYPDTSGGVSYYKKEAITERIGGDYLFYFNKADCFDGVQYNNFLCYQDNTLGLYQGGQKPCDYTTYQVGIEELGMMSDELKVYPNPASYKLVIRSNKEISDMRITVVNLTGATLINAKCKSNCELDISSLKEGVYFVNIYQAEKFMGVKKLVVLR